MHRCRCRTGRALGRLHPGMDVDGFPEERPAVELAAAPAATGRPRHYPAVDPAEGIHRQGQARRLRSHHRGLDRVGDRRLPGSAHLDRLPRRDAMAMVCTARGAGRGGYHDGADQHASPGVEGPPAPLPEGTHRRPYRRVDRHRDRRLRSGVEMDRLCRKHSLGLARDAPAVRVPDHPAPGIAQLGLGQCRRARQPGTPGGHRPDSCGCGRNIAARTHSLARRGEGARPAGDARVVLAAGDAGQGG